MKIILFILLCVFTVNGYSQHIKEDYTYTNAPIIVVLSDIEKAFNVKFSYNPTTIKGIKVTLHQENISLIGILETLKDKYFISFDKIDDRYYVINKEKSVPIIGYVNSALSKRPLIGAVVQIKGKNWGVVTNESGYFKLKEVYRSDSLLISYLAYKPVVLPVHEIEIDSCLSVSLFPDIKILNEITIKEYLGSGFEILKDGSVEINPKRQDILAGLLEPDILENAQLLPGIVSPSETATDLYIRGGAPNQNLVLWDGIKIYKSDHFFGSFTAFNSSVIDNVQVFRSGTKPKYGDRVSGVLDISTDNTVPSKLQGGFGSNSISFDAYLKLPISSKLGVIMSYRRSLSDLIETKALNQYFDKSFQNTNIEQNEELNHPSLIEEEGLFNFYDCTLKAIWDVSERDKISLSNLFTSNRLDYYYSVPYSNYKYVDELKINNLGIGVDWSRKWNQRLSTNTHLYFTKYKFNYAGSRSFSYDSRNIIKNNRLREIGLLIDSHFKLNTKFELTYGYQFFTNNIDFELRNYDFLESGKFKSLVHSFYSKLSYDKANVWKIDIGLRGTYFNALQSVSIEPRLYAEYIVNDDFRFKGSAELKTQSINQILELTTSDFGLENQIWIASHKEGTPLVMSDQLTFGILFSKNDFLFDLDLYYKNIDGFSSITKGFELLQTNFSEGLSTTKGVDVLIKKKINSYTSWFAYTYSTTSFLFDNLNNAQEFRGNNDITHSITWSHFYKWKNFKFSLAWKSRTGIPYTPANGISKEGGYQMIEYETINSARLPSYHRLDISTFYNFKLSSKKNGIKGKIGFSLLNVFNNKSILNRKYSFFVDNNSLQLQQIDRLSLGFTPNFLFRIDF